MGHTMGVFTAVFGLLFVGCMQAASAAIATGIDLNGEYMMELEVTPSKYLQGQYNAFKMNGATFTVTVLPGGDNERKMKICVPVTKWCHTTHKAVPVGSTLKIKVTQFPMRPNVDESFVTTLYINGYYAQNWGHHNNPYPAANFRVRGGSLVKGKKFRGDIKSVRVWS